MRFNSNTPPIPPIVIAVSLPITCAHTWIMDSQITGFTFPGIMDEPGWMAGNVISANPARGPEPNQRISLAIFDNDTANVFNAPEVSTAASWAACASKWLAASVNLTPERVKQWKR